MIPNQYSPVSTDLCIKIENYIEEDKPSNSAKQTVASYDW